MNKIENAFKNQKAFIAFVTCGDPTLEITKELIYEMAESGASLIELGIPFSDPTAEGIVIQTANERALATGLTTDKVFEMLEDVAVDIPLVFMTYANVLFSYGIERFVKKAKSLGVSGVILPDIPYEEKDEFQTVCDRYNFDFISLIAPTSCDRIEMIAKEAKGFVYCVSSLGVTGVRSDIQSDVKSMTDIVKKHSKVPCAIGFGISTPEKAKEMSQFADGVIVGSAIVKLCEEHKEKCVPYVKEYVQKMCKAIRRD
ncbi:MAG: tryptophan synthase subunit alpha [Clostridia bacterium]